MTKETILYVDDEQINIELFKANFEDEFNIITAESGKKGLEIVKSRKDINIVVSDIKMPEMNGFELIQHIKMFAPNTICIILSAFLKSDFPKNSINEKDIFRYLSKPWRRHDMNRTILEAIDTYKTLQEA